MRMTPSTANKLPDNHAASEAAASHRRIESFTVLVSSCLATFADADAAAVGLNELTRGCDVRKLGQTQRRRREWSLGRAISGTAGQWMQRRAPSVQALH